MQEQIVAVQKMQDYINAHINENITLADLSKASLFSPWYSYRLFKEYTNYTPAEYIRRLRLSKSAMKLKDEKYKVIDAAYELGFQSVDGYQRAFQKEFGCNPSEYARNPVPIYLFIPYGVVYKEIRKEHTEVKEVKSVFIQTVRKPARKVIIKRGIKAKDYFAYCEEVGCDVWGLLSSMDTISGEPVCLWLPKQYQKPDTSEYVQGVEVALDYNGIVPEGFDVIELPEGDFVMFQGEPFAEVDYCEAIDEVKASIDKYNPCAMGYKWDYTNPRIQLEPMGARGYIEMIPVRRVESSL